MKKIIRMVGLMSFIVFGFYYTDRVMEVIREEDQIMIQLHNIEDSMMVNAVDAKIVGETIMPGLNGKAINLDKSYKQMKGNGVFNQDNLVFDTIYPDISIMNYKDRYLILGNPYRQMVSLIFLLDNDKYLEQIENIVDNKDVVVNYFVNYSYLVSNTISIKEMSDKEFYSYGNYGVYTLDNLLFSNNLISRISNNNANLCLVQSKNKSVLELCSKNDLYTIIPNIIVKEQPYNTVKNQLVSGSMILFSMNQDTIKELEFVIDYIRGKGFKIVGLSKLLSENLD